MSCPPDCSEHGGDALLHKSRAQKASTSSIQRSRWLLLAASLTLLGVLVQPALAEIVFWPARLDFALQGGVTGGPVGIGPVAIGDLNGDEVLDLAVTNQEWVAVLPGRGDGTVGDASYLAAGEMPRSIAIGHVNADQALDLVAVEGPWWGQPGHAVVMLGVGDGTFAPGRFVEVGVDPQSVAIGDLNGDGISDLAVANAGELPTEPASVAVLLGVGDGSFLPVDFYAVGDMPYSLSIGDLNGDQAPDLVVAEWRESAAVVLLGVGDGTFAPAVFYYVGVCCVSSVAISDLDGDQVPDLAAALGGWYGGGIAVLLGVGDGTFYPANIYGDDSALELAIGDMNGDQIPDIVSGSVYLGVGDGSFVQAGDYSAAGDGLVLGDLNDDQALDLAMGSGVLLGFGDGTFAEASTYDIVTGPEGAEAVALEDLNGDQIPDVAVFGYEWTWGGVVDVRLGTGDGSFGESMVSGPWYPAGTSSATGDLNGDQVLDLAIAAFDEVAVVVGHGDGTFSNDATYYPVGPQGHGSDSIALGDLNGDQILDIVVARGDCDEVAVLLGVGDGSFLPANFFQVGVNPSAVAIGDVNGDEVLDIVAVHRSDTNLAVLLGIGDGMFAPAVYHNTGAGVSTSVGIGDVNGDQAVDLIVTVDSPGVAVLLGVGDGSFLQASLFEIADLGGSVVLADFNADHLVDIAVPFSDGISSVAVLLGFGDGSFDRASYYGADGEFGAVADLNGDQAPDLVTAGDHVAILLGTGGGPVPVELAWFEVVASTDAVTVAWETSFEANHLGFHLHRAKAGSGRFDRVNDELIPSTTDYGQRYGFIDRRVVAGETYSYRLEAVDTSGGTQIFSLGSVTVGPLLPATMVLHQNHPNPFNPSTSIAFELPEAAHVTLRIYDVSGSLVRTLVDTRLARSSHAVEWDGRDDFGREVGSGVYHYRIEAGAQSISRKMIMVH